jgi:hypothetical protein
MDGYQPARDRIFTTCLARDTTHAPVGNVVVLTGTSTARGRADLMQDPE